jgi:hypothetical protein
MQVEIFIRTYHKDLNWLCFALRSIRKFCTGFAGVTVAVPEHDLAAAKFTLELLGDRVSYRLCPHEEVKDKAFLSGIIQLYRCDSHVPRGTTHVLLMDSDCVFTNPTTPQDYLIGGKPVMIGHPRWDIDKRAAEGDQHLAGIVHWFTCCERALGFYPQYEFMSRHPALYPTWIFEKARNAVASHVGMEFDDFVLSCKAVFPHTFADLTTLGAFANRYNSDHFVCIDKLGMDYRDYVADSGNSATEDRLKQFWSHGGVFKHMKELESILK